MSKQLPLFPLNTVLFPGAPLTLHIFEDRYRLMVGDCLEQGKPFGVVFVHDPGIPKNPVRANLIGTVAQINASVRLEDGRYLIATVGQKRFQVMYTVQVEPYIIALVTFLSEEHSPAMLAASQDLRDIHDRYWNAVARATGTSSQAEQLPEDAIAMIYSLSHRMQVTNERKQHWLEVDSTTRVREISAMLRAEMSLLPHPDLGQASKGGEMALVLELDSVWLLALAP